MRAFLVRNHHSDPLGTCDWSGWLRQCRRGEGDVDDAEHVCGIFFFGTRVRENGGDFKKAVTDIYNNILASKPNERAIAVANEIKTEHPDIIALQEAWILRTGVAGAPATNVKSDQLDELLNELHQQRLPYEVIAILPNLDAQAPTQPQLGFDVRLTDRTVIIADPRGLKLANMRVQDYLVNSVVTPPVGVPIINKRGWASVELTLAGHSLRIATTHLDNTPGNTPPPFAIQMAQAAEAIGSLNSRARPGHRQHPPRVRRPKRGPTTLTMGVLARPALCSMAAALVDRAAR
jgi:hypothetical protein